MIHIITQKEVHYKFSRFRFSQKLFYGNPYRPERKVLQKIRLYNNRESFFELLRPYQQEVSAVVGVMKREGYKIKEPSLPKTRTKKGGR